MTARFTCFLLTGSVLALALIGCAGNDQSNYNSVRSDKSSVAQISPEASKSTNGVFPNNLQVTRAFSNLSFDALTNLVQVDDGKDRIFVTEQVGLIHVFPNDNEIVSADVFLDIRDRVSTSGNEEGLLGLAFHPEYRETGYFFVYYSSSSPRRSIVSRFYSDPRHQDRVNPRTEFVIMEIGQPFSNHNGGQIAFGPDGYLYISVGDGGFKGDPHSNGQNLGTLLGTILRIDVDSLPTGKSYGIPPDNPFVEVDGARQEIWAYGLRNPWRFSFDRFTGSLLAGDVGQNDWEEINVIQKGLNYGWDIMEGNHCFSPQANCVTVGLELPAAEYSQSEGCAVVGGHFYRGSGLPSLSGTYVYGDYCSGKIWGLQFNGQSVTNQEMLIDSDLSITSFGQDLTGNLYILTRNDGIFSITNQE